MSRSHTVMLSLLIAGLAAPAIALAANTTAGPFSIPDLDTVLQNIQSQMGFLWKLMTSFAFLAGFFCIFKAVYQLKQYGHGMSMMSQQHDLRGPIIMLVMGAALIWLPSAVKSMMISLFGNNDILSYPVFSSVDPSFNLMGTVLTKIVSFVGIVAFIRGLLMFHSLGEGKAHGQQSFAKAATHLFGGVLALNIVGTAKVIGSTLGITW